MDKKNEIDDNKSDAEVQAKMARRTKKRRLSLWMAAVLMHNGQATS